MSREKDSPFSCSIFLAPTMGITGVARWRRQPSATCADERPISFAIAATSRTIALGSLVNYQSLVAQLFCIESTGLITCGVLIRLSASLSSNLLFSVNAPLP
jgi:hypothetical protein